MPSRLKSLELQGYKTFANRTLFEFADTITAIVGPNGSGKSNIADSLRWVLGEQSYSLLRARKTEDMIFSGSENRPRAGFATATVVFDNTDGWLPIDFSEVAIARRAHRDGQNEYLINGQRVRLKDVSELLAQSGLAERTYTVIGQGLVDAALALKAEERRRLFEEAAGIGLHRSRREEALRRLDTTKRNLERVQDIMAELRPRLRSLERQARRAEQYEQVKADLQVLLREYYGYHWHRAQRDLAEAQRAAKQQERNLDDANQAHADLEDKLEQIRRNALGMRQSLNEWHRQLAGLHTKREAISRDLAVAGERSHSLDERQAALHRELSNRAQEIELYQLQADAANKELQRLETETAETIRQADQAELALSARIAERAQAEKRIDECRSELAKLNARQGQLGALSAERRSQLEKSKAELEQISTTLSAAKQGYLKARSEYLSAQQALSDTQAVMTEIEADLHSERQRLNKQSEDRQAILTKLADINAAIARYGAELDVLDQAEASLSGYAGGARVLLQAARQNNINGVRGALSNHLEVPSGLETAITAALGDFLDAVLLDGDPENALDMLSDQGERGVLLPLARLQNVPPADRARVDGQEVIGVAADLVEAPQNLRTAIGLLLGDIYVTHDRAAARRVLEGNSTGVRAVTLSGEVFHASGPVQVRGKDEPSAAGSLLGRRRRRSELQEQVQSAENEHNALQSRLVELDNEIKNVRQLLETLEERHRETGQRTAKSDRAVGQTRLALERAEQQAEWQVNQSRRLKAEIANTHTELEKMSTEMVGLEEEITEARQRQRQTSQALAELTLDEYQSQAAHWKTLVSVTQRSLADANGRLSERQAALERTLNLHLELQVRLAEIEQTRDETLTKQEQQRQTEGELAEAISKLNEHIQPAEAELAEIEKEGDKLAELEVKSRGRLSQAEHFNAQTRIELARRQEGLQTLRHRIEDDLGLVAFEYEQQISGPKPLPLQGLVEQLPVVRRIPPELDENIKRQRAQLRRMGAINPEAQSEYKEVKERYESMTEQIEDLKKAEEDVRQVIKELDEMMQRAFRQTFDAVAAEFRGIFTRLFDGGSARLVLTDPDDLTLTGIDIEARLPGRRTQGLSLLSGGERSLTATALVFSLLRVSPTPFCVLDEVDAMLDESNVGRFRELLRELSENTQFVIVTHNRNTVQVADMIYGVTMGRDSTSQVLSLKLDEVEQVVGD